MKDEINLATTFSGNKKSWAGRTRHWEHRLKILNLIAAVFLFLFLISLLAIVALEKAAMRRTLKNEAEIASLSADSKIISSLIDRQTQLKAIKKNSPNLREGVESIQKIIPQNVSLNNLSVTVEKTTLAAQTDSIQAFSQFINSLKKTGTFKTIYLTTSSYDAKLNLFNFALECFTN